MRPARTGAVWHGPFASAQRYLLLFASSLASAAAQTRNDLFRAIDLHYELSLELAEQRKFVCSRALEPPMAAATVRYANGDHTVTDGPYAETKEFAAGFFEIACDTHDEAMKWGHRFMHGLDAVEVRPVWTDA